MDTPTIRMVNSPVKTIRAPDGTFIKLSDTIRWLQDSADATDSVDGEAGAQHGRAGHVEARVNGHSVHPAYGGGGDEELVPVPMPYDRTLLRGGEYLGAGARPDLAVEGTIIVSPPNVDGYFNDPESRIEGYHWEWTRSGGRSQWCYRPTPTHPDDPSRSYYEADEDGGDYPQGEDQ